MIFEVPSNSFNFTYSIYENGFGKITARLLFRSANRALSLSLSFSYLIHIPVPFFHCITLPLAATQTLHRPRTVGHSLCWAELDPPTRERLLFAVKSSLLCLPSQHIHFRPQLRSLCVAFEFHSLCIHALMRFMTYCQATFNY